MSITLRRATPADGPAIAALFMSSPPDALPYLPELHTEDDTLDHFTNTVPARCEVWVAEEGAKLFGFMAWNGETEYLDHLYLMPGQYRQGIGTRLLDKAKSLSDGKIQL